MEVPMKKIIPGILLCLVIVIPIWILVLWIKPLSLIGAPILGILTGMIVTRLIRDQAVFKAGIGFTSKKILQYAVVLLGFGLNLSTVAKVGLLSLPMIVATISVSLLVAYVLHRTLHIPGKTATLIGVGSSICGGSAIAATAPVIHAEDDDIAQAISVIFFFNIIAAMLFPSLGQLLGLSNHGFGLFAGTAINDTSSVTAAALAWDSIHHTGTMVLDYATIVKLTRTLAIIPITLILSFLTMKKEHGKVSAKAAFPMFILYFLLASVVTTLVTSFCSGTVLQCFQTGFGWMKELSRFMIVMAMTAIGLNTDIVKLVKNGGKALFLGFCCSVSIAVVSLILQLLVFKAYL